MASSTAAASSSRAIRLSRLFASPSPSRSPTARPTKSSRPIPKPPAGDAASDEGHGLRALLKIQKRVFRERDPDRLVSEFIAASAKDSRFQYQHRVYEVAVARLVSMDRRDCALAILDAQKPFIETFTEDFAARLIRLYGYASMPSHAAATFHDLLPQHKTTMTFNSLLTAYAHAGELETFATVFQEIPASYPSIVPSLCSYNILIRVLCQKADLSAAVDTITLMEKRGVSPDTISFNTLLNGFYHNGLLDEAETVWEMMKERNVEPDTKSYNAKLRGLIAKHKIADAVAVVERMEKDGKKPNTVSYNQLIQAYCKDGKLDEAKKLYDDMVKRECRPNKATYEILLPPLVQAGQLDCAVKYCDENFRNRCKLNLSTLQEVVTALAAASRVQEATRIVELGRKRNKYNLKNLIMLRTGEVNEAQAEINVEESVSEAKECEEEEGSEK